MGTPRTLGAVTIIDAPTPALFAAAGYTGTVIAAASFTIKNGIATIFLGSTLPTDGYNGPNGYPTQNGTTGAKFDIYGGVSGQNNAGSPNNGGNAAGGQQVCLWGFTFGTYFNGKTVTVLDCDPSTNSFRFYFNHANVSASRYITALSLAGQVAVEISSDNLRADRVMLASTSILDTVQVSLIY